MNATRNFTLMACLFVCLLPGCGQRALDRELLWAAGNGQVVEVERLISKGANVNFKSPQSGNTPLIWAVIERQERIVGVLLRAGADPNLRNRTGEAPLFFAFTTEADLGPIIRMLIVAGAETEEYMWLFESLPEDHPNRIAFNEAIELRKRGVTLDEVWGELTSHRDGDYVSKSEPGDVQLKARNE